MDVKLDIRALDGAAFDMDGVVTDTARMHEGAWKAVFDAYLAAREGEPPFSHQDYVHHVDGRSRRDGARAFLGSRGIEPAASDLDAVCEDKNAAFRQALEQGGVEVLPGARLLLGDLRACGLRTGLFTASRNAGAVLAAAGLEDAFDARVDGETARAEGIAGLSLIHI